MNVNPKPSPRWTNAAREAIRRVSIDDYIESVDGDASRASWMYRAADALCQDKTAPDPVMDVFIDVADSWLAATASIPCDSDAAAGAKIDALLHYFATDDAIELNSSIESMVREVRAWRARPTEAAALEAN